MAFIDGAYKPIRVLFGTDIYKQALQFCWTASSYKVQTAVVIQLLRLQEKKLIPAEVTVEDMTDLLVEESKRTLRVQLWEFELEGFDAEVTDLLSLVWDVNTTMKMRDIGYEARKLFTWPENMPPRFDDAKIVNSAQDYARMLTEQHQKETGHRLLGPRDVVVKVVSRILQGFWEPHPTTFLNMPSQLLSKTAVSVTKAVLDQVSGTLSTTVQQVSFSRSIRDTLVLSISEKVRQAFTLHGLLTKLACFAADVLTTIADAAAGEICALFEPKTLTAAAPADLNTNKEDQEDHIQPDVSETTEKAPLGEEPEPAPVQEPTPEPEQATEQASEVKPEPASEPKPELEPEHEPASELQPKEEPTQEPKPELEPIPELESKLEPTPLLKQEPAREPKPELGPKQEPAPSQKQEQEPAPEPDCLEQAGEETESSPAPTAVAPPPAAPQILPDQPAVITAAKDDISSSQEEPEQREEVQETTTTTEMKKRSSLQRLCHWLNKRVQRVRGRLQRKQ